MGELRVHSMAHLGFHRGGQKDKDKERGHSAPASDEHERRESAKHEKPLHKESRALRPGAAALTETAAAVASQTQTPSHTPSQASSQATSQTTSQTPSQTASQASSRQQSQFGPRATQALPLGSPPGSRRPSASPPESVPDSRPGSPPLLTRSPSFNSVFYAAPSAKGDDEYAGASQRTTRPAEPVVVPFHGDHQPSGTLLYTAGTGRPPRLEVFDVGNDKRQHWHHLRPARRQEKLSRMLKDLFKREPHHDADGNVQDHSPTSSRAGSPGPAQKTDSLERDRDAAEAVFVASRNQPPSLLSGIESQLQSSERDPAEVLNQLLNQRKVTDPTLVERYGQLSSVVGKGSFGVVRLAQKADPYNKNRKLVYAVKEFHPNAGESESRYLKRLASEFCLASSLHNVNIIHTLDLLRDGKSKYCGVMEYCAGGDLYSLIVVAGKLEPVEADCFFKQIMRGVSYMHEMGVAHRDLKPENILLTSRGCCKLTDFGNAECFRMAWEKDVHMSSDIAGSGPYIAPEEYKKSEFDPRAVDVWAAGVIYMAMSTGRHLWREAKSSDEFYGRYLEGRKCESGYEPIERLKMAKRRNVIYSVLDPVASRRLTARQVLNSEWGREISVCEAGAGEAAWPASSPPDDERQR